MLVLFLSNSRGVASTAFFRIGIFKLVIFLFLDSAIFFQHLSRLWVCLTCCEATYICRIIISGYGDFLMLYLEDNSMQVAVEAIRLCEDLTLGK